MRKVLLVIVPVLVCFLVGFVGSQAQEMSIATWYPTLVKPALTPPNIVFPIAWSILYLAMGVSIGLILISKSKDRRFFVTLFAVQLLLNVLWSFLFFKMQNPLLGLIDILLLDIVVVWYAIASWRNHKASSILFWPYALWLLFATYLNLFILMNN